MEQRPLRLGDILDDYCPRERRVTNHAVVAMIGENVKQTRCTTCDAEHPYKGGQAPRRRRKETPSALYKEVLSGRPDPDAPPTVSAPSSGSELSPTVEAAEDEFHGDALMESRSTPAEAVVAESDERAPEIEDGPVHRPLIRATLPRPEGQKDARPLPDFTVRHAGGRGNAQFRGGNTRLKSRGGQGGNGHRPHGGPRFAGAKPGHGRGPGGGFRSSHQPRHGGKKRSR